MYNVYTWHAQAYFMDVLGYSEVKPNSRYRQYVRNAIDTFMAEGLHYFRDWPTSAAHAHNVEGLLKGSFFHLMSINMNKVASKSCPMVFKMTIKLKLLRNAYDFEYKLAI